jgi:Tol biopolymer transport system component
MGTRREEVSGLKIRLLFFGLTLVVMIALAEASPRGLANGVPALPMPRVTSIAQATNDGLRKSSLLAGDSQLYVTELSGARRVIARVSLPGTASGPAASGSSSAGRSVVPSSLSNLQALDLSPDGTKLLVSSTGKSGESELWILPVGAGTPERVGDLTGRDASWSMDGKQLVFVKGAVLYVANANGSEARQLYSANGSVFAPRFSPDGARIRFTVSDTERGTTALWEVNRDGAGAHALLDHWDFKSTACCGSWTADGHYYVFQATQTIPNTTTIVTSLWALSETAGADQVPAVVPLTNGPMSYGNAFLSRDTTRGTARNTTLNDRQNNTKIFAIGVHPAGEVVKYDPAKKKFLAVIPGVSATDLDFSADAKWVTYVAIPEGTLWRSKADGTERLQLTFGPGQAALPHWSPDGKQIAYASLEPGQSWKISLVTSDGGKSQDLLTGQGGQIDASWSADGTRLMFGDFAFDAGGLSIRIMNFKTHTVEKIHGSEGLFSPRWSPDGRYIAAMAPGNKALMLFDFQSQKWTKWLSDAGTVNYPVWSADSKSLYFDDFVDDAESIRRLKLGESQPERVFVLGSLERFPGAMGQWSGRAADGSWMFVRDRSTQEVYQLSVELP